MRLASLRLGILLATLVASLHVAAVPRFWTLTGVQFNDGTSATGYFSYDDATQTIENWNVRVAEFVPFRYPAYTFVPGNSAADTSQAPYEVPRSLIFSARVGVDAPWAPEDGWRFLRIAPVTPLDGSSVTVALITYPDYRESSHEFFGDGNGGRGITAGSLTLTPVPPPIVIVQVDEFYHPVLRHYFITASAAEKQDLDTSVHSGWVRTRESFKAYATGSSPSGSINPVCRYYSPPIIEFEGAGSDSHFFSADAGECLSVFRKYWSLWWRLEDDNAFQITLPDKASGACPVATIPVYRLWNQRADSNHRYTTSAAIKADMLAAGYRAEGYGPDDVVMCAVQ